MNDQYTKMQLIECYHCGNKTLMSVVAHYSFDHEESYYDSDGDEISQLISSNTWKLLVCPVCNETTLLKSYWEPNMVEPNGDQYEYDDILYPMSTYKGSGVPQKVNNAFEASLKARHLDASICLLALRRTLEIICKDKGANDGFLEAKIKKLTNDGILPPTLNEVSKIIKKLGNEAAHGDDVIHTKKGVSEMIEFVENIINYVYVLPYKISKIKNG